MPTHHHEPHSPTTLQSRPISDVAVTAFPAKWRKAASMNPTQVEVFASRRSPGRSRSIGKQRSPRSGGKGVERTHAFRLRHRRRDRHP